MLAAVAVIEIAMICPMESAIPFTWYGHRDSDSDNDDLLDDVDNHIPFDWSTKFPKGVKIFRCARCQDRLSSGTPVTQDQLVRDSS